MKTKMVVAVWLSLAVASTSCERTPRAAPTTRQPLLTTVTTTLDLGHGGNLESGTELGTDRVVRSKPQAAIGPWTMSTPLVTARRNHQAVVANGFLYFVGGSTIAGSLDIVQIAPINGDGTLGAVMNGGTFTTARQFHTSHAYNGYLYVIGGTTGLANLNDVQVARINADGTLNPFVATSSFTSARSGHASVIHAGYLYVIGGSGVAALADIQVARINADGTLGPFATSTTTIPTARTLHTAVASDGVLYVIGGRNTAGFNLNDVQVARLDPADGAVGAFSPATSFGTARERHTSVVHAGSLYVIGGIGDGTPTADVQVARVLTDGLLGPFAPGSALPAARSGHASVAWNGFVFTTAGNNVSGSPQFTNLVARADANGTLRAFAATTPIPSPARSMHASATYNGFVYVTGGMTAGGVNLDEVWVAQSDPVTGALGAFMPTTPLPSGRRDHAAVAYNSRLYIVGGVGDSGDLNDVHVAPIFADGTLGAFSPNSSFLTPRGGHSALAHNGVLYVLGGKGLATNRNDVQSATISVSTGDLSAFSTQASTFTTPRFNHGALIYNGFLYVSGGGSVSGDLADVQRAPLASNGTVGAFTATTSLPSARQSHIMLALNGYLYAVGGSGAEVQRAPINLDGSLGAFNPTTPLLNGVLSHHTAVVSNGAVYVLGGYDGATPVVAVSVARVNTAGAVGSFAATTPFNNARYGHTSVASSGFLYVAGGFAGAYFDTVQVARINANGTVGAFTATSPFATARRYHTSVTHNGNLYVIGGFNGTARNDVQVARINADGTLQPFTATASFTGARSQHASVVYNGFLYVIGGNNGTAPITSVQVAPINPDGTLGTFVATTALPQGRDGHGGVAYDGHLYVVGGYTGSSVNSVLVAPINADGTLGAFTTTSNLGAGRDHLGSVALGGFLYAFGGRSASRVMNDVEVAPINSDGTLGAFVATTPLPSARSGHASALSSGFLYVLGGEPAAGYLDDVQVARLNAPTARATWSKVVDLGSPSTVVSLTANGAANRGSLSLDYRAAPPSGIFGPLTSRGVIPLGTPVLLGGSNTRHLWVRFTFDDTFTQSTNPDAVDERDLTDFIVVHNPDPVVSPATATVAPRASRAFTCSGGSGSGYVFALNPNASGGSINGTGGYIAGNTGSVGDVVTCTDSALAVGSAAVTVTAGVTVSPQTPSTPPRGSLSFSASGGSNSGFNWSMAAAPSGGTISPAGAYQAGAIGSVVDTVQVIDSLGNVATTPVTVTQVLALLPGTVTRPPRGTLTFSTFGGSDAGMTFSPITNASGMTINSSSGLYTAGTVGSVTDVVGVTDSLGNTATATVTVSGGVWLNPASATVPPRGSQLFVADGGSATGFTWLLTTNGSSGTIDAGSYRAGATASTTDIAEVTDSLGNTASAIITVTGGVLANPTSATVAPRGTRSFSASGGSGTGFGWAMQMSGSGGNVTAPGVYTAGPTGSSLDVLRVTDSLGNTADVNVSVSPGIRINPATPSTPPSGSIDFDATDGSGLGFTWALTTIGSNGATINPTTGVYVAGNQQGTDRVQVTDSLNNTAFVDVDVTTSLRVSPGTLTAFPPRGAQVFTGSGGSGMGFTWALQTNASGATFNPTTAAYQAGPLGGVTDVIRLTDSLNNTATATITLGPAVSISPAAPAATPRGALTFTATGGSSSGFTWSLQANPSGGTIGAGGMYVAGTTGGVTDVVLVTDSLGNTATAAVTVGAGVTISPPTVMLAPRDSTPLTAMGGSGTGFSWAFVTNASMGSLNAGTGVYRAGSLGSVTDVVQVTDSLGNVAQRDIEVTAGVTITPDAGSAPPRGTLALVAMGGSGGGYTWTFTTNRSGGTLSPTNGVYQAGATPSVDEVQVVDSLGNSGAATVTVTAGLSITPANPTVTPLEAVPFVAAGGGGTRQWRVSVNSSGASIDDITGAYVAGGRGGTNDTVEVRDSLGNVATTRVTVTDALRLSPGMVALPPRGPQVFLAQGGADGGYSFRVANNLSGASIDPLTGAYVAGPTGQVVDMVEVSDSAGATATARVTVGDAVSISPARADVASGARQLFAATGGSGEGYKWSIALNASGGSIDAASGEYLAGATPENVTDEVQVTDSLENVAIARVTVVGGEGSKVPPAERAPANGWSCGCEAGSSSGGPALVGLAVLAVLSTRRRRRASVGVVVALLVVLVPLETWAAPKKKNPPAKVTAPAPVVTPPAPAPVVEPPKEIAAPTPPAPPRPKGRPSVAVLDVDVTVPGEKLDAAAFSEMVLNAVDSAKTFKVISSKEISTMLGIERQKQLLGCGEESTCMTEIANALGSDFVMVGSVGRVGDNYLVSTRLINGATNKVTARASVQAKSANSLLEAVWRATQQTLDGYGASLSAAEAQAWAARPKPTPPATLVAVDETPSRFGVSATAAFGYQPLSTPGNRGSVGAQVDLTFRRGRLDLAAGVVIAPSPGARVTATWALTDQRARVDVGLRGSLFPGLGYYGGGLTSGFEFGLNDHFALNARVAVEAYPVQGTVVLALLGGAGVSARF